MATRTEMALTVVNRLDRTLSRALPAALDPPPASMPGLRVRGPVLNGMGADGAASRGVLPGVLCGRTSPAPGARRGRALSPV